MLTNIKFVMSNSICNIMKKLCEEVYVLTEWLSEVLILKYQENYFKGDFVFKSIWAEPVLAI